MELVILVGVGLLMFFNYVVLKVLTLWIFPTWNSDAALALLSIILALIEAFWYLSELGKGLGQMLL